MYLKTDPNPIIPSLYSHLIVSGFKVKGFGLGFNENTYSLWYKFLILNLLFLVTTEFGKKEMNTFESDSFGTGSFYLSVEVEEGLELIGKLLI